MIPILIPIARVAMTQESGMLTVALCSEDPENATVNEIIDSLVKDESILRFCVYSSPEEAQTAVKKQKADVAWIFSENFEKKIDDYLKKESTKPFITTFIRENTIPIQLANEKLFAAVYPHISYEIYDRFVTENIAEDKGITEKTVKKYYDDMQNNGSLIKMKKLDSDESVDEDKNYLLAPMRGMLALIIMFCGFAGAMYFLRDQAEGKYDWLSYKKRMAPAFGSCLAAISISAIAVLAALFISGMAAGGIREIPAMIMYVFCAAGFCLILCTLFRTAGKLGATIPFFMIIMLVVCPIFFSVNFGEKIRLLFPVYYYLRAVYDGVYLIYMLLYSLITYSMAYLLNLLLNVKERRISHLS